MCICCTMLKRGSSCGSQRLTLSSSSCGEQVLQASLAAMQAKDEELRAAQLAYLHSQNWLKAIQARITAQVRLQLVALQPGCTLRLLSR